MKNIKKKFVMILILFIVILCFQFMTVFSNVKATNETEDVYDIILFWGQSNMVGRCGLKNNEKQADTRYNRLDANSVKEYSEKTGIDEEFLANAEPMNYVKITQIPETVYEYMYTTDSLVELNEQTQYNGERLLYENNKLQKADSKFSIEKSCGTTLVPQFCKTYYEKTGHKVVAVFASNGGEQIANFLPSTDENYADNQNQMIYEAMVEKYKSAIKYMESKGYKIGNKSWVCFQGEDNTPRTSTLEYKMVFKKVHDYLKNDLDINKGAIIETSCTLGRNYEGVQNIHKAQEELIKENSDIVLGSSYDYDHYVPSKEVYESDSYNNSLFTDENGNKLNYDIAFDIASKSVCYPSNTIHFTSSALCQIGKEAGENLANAVDYTNPEGNVSYSEKEKTRKPVTVTITSNEELQEVEGWTLSKDKKSLTKVYTENGKEEITIYDLAGNSKKVSIEVSNIDKESPKSNVEYSTTEATNKDVTVTITSNEELQEVEGWTLSKDKKTLTKVYTENEKEEVTIYDLAGNSEKVNIEVSNIDKESPKSNVEYSTTEATNKDVTVTITSNEELQEVEGWTLSEDKKTLTKVYTENGKEEITIYDLAGNSEKVNIEVSNINKNISENVDENVDKNTNENIDENVDENTNENIDENVDENVDKNTDKNIDESVSKNEDKVSPIGKVSYSTTQTTDKYVTVTITSNEELKEIAGWTLSKDKKSLTKMYIKNKKETVVIYDLAGNKTELQINVNNIQRELPTVFPKTGSKAYILFVEILICSIMSIIFYKKSK